MRDIAENKIEVGSMILYAASAASMASLRWGRVERVAENPDRIRIQGMDPWHILPHAGLRRTLTTLHNPDRVVVMPWFGSIPLHIRELFDPDGRYSQNNGVSS